MCITCPLPRATCCETRHKDLLFLRICCDAFVTATATTQERYARMGDRMVSQEWSSFSHLVAQLTAPHSSAQTRSNAGSQLMQAYTSPATAHMLCTDVLPYVVECACATGDPAQQARHNAVPGVDEATLFFAVKALRAAVTSQVEVQTGSVTDVMLQLCLRSQCVCVTSVVNTQCHLGVADAAKMSAAHTLSNGGASSELSDYVFQVLADACNDSNARNVAAAFSALTTVIAEMVIPNTALALKKSSVTLNFFGICMPHAGSSRFSTDVPTAAVSGGVSDREVRPAMRALCPRI